MRNKFTKRAEDALRNAKALAEDMGHTYIGSEHILIGLLSESGSIASKLLRSKGLDKDKLVTMLCTIAGKGELTCLTPDDMTSKAKKALLDAGRLGEKSFCECIGTEHLLSAILDDTSGAVRLLCECGIDAEELKNDLNVFFCSVDEMREKSPKKEAPSASSKKSGTSLLQYGKNMTEDALNADKDPVIGREREISRVITILSRKTKNNPLLIGDPGVGKTAIAEGLAIAIAKRQVPEVLYGKRIIALDIASMIAGAKYRGEFEERLKGVISEAMKDPDIILFIDEIHTIIGAGSAEGAMDAANILKPPLARGDIRVIGATTFDEYTRHIERDAALERRFQSVKVAEPTEKDTEMILYGLKDGLERHHGVIINYSAITEAVRLSVRYMHDRFLPDKAIDVLDEAASYLSLRQGKEPEDITSLRNEITGIRAKKENAIYEGNIEKAERIRKKEISKTKELVSKRTDWEIKRKEEKPILDAAFVKESLRDRFGDEVIDGYSIQGIDEASLYSALTSRIYGQDKACNAVADSVLRARIGLRDSGKPIGSFIFFGPSGVGKTALARALAENLYGKSSFIKLDMSEYSERQSISRLIGSPPGYVGYDEPGKLTGAVRTHPECIILFDELDKACPEVYGLLLQILDEGILTDGRGRRAHFSNAIIIATCNTAKKGHSIGFNENDVGAMRADLQRQFGSELICRFDEVIGFDELNEESKYRIAEDAISRISEKLSAIGYSVKADSEFINQISVGARGGRGVLQNVSRYVERPISKMIINDEIKRHGEYLLNIVNGKTAFKVAEKI